MSFGFRTVNDFGTVQIDADYSNYALLQTSTITLFHNTPTTVTFPTQSEPPLIVISGIPNGYGVALSSEISSTSFLLRHYYSIDPNNYQAFAFLDGSGTPLPTITCTCKLYTRASSLAQSAQTHGMRVFKGDGSLVFDSGLDYVRISSYVVAINVKGSSITAFPTNTTVAPNSGVVINNTYNWVGFATLGSGGGLGVTVIYGWVPVVYSSGLVSMKLVVVETSGQFTPLGYRYFSDVACTLLTTY